MEIHQELRESTEAALAKGEALVKVRRTQCNIKAAIEALSVCLPVLNMYSKLTEQMNEKRYYPALKTIELLEHTYLPLIKKHKFAGAMEQKLPKFRKHIEEASMTELKDFLESIHEVSARIGDTAINQANEQYLRETNALSNGSIVSVQRYNGTTGDLDDNREQAAHELVDFSPVYRCYHIFTVLGVGAKFRAYYQSSRAEQAKIALQPGVNLLSSLEGYRQYFNEVAGFFVVEEHIAHTAGGLLSQNDLEASWAEAVERVTNVLRTSTGYCTEATAILRIKSLITLFAYTLKVSELSDFQLLDFIPLIRLKAFMVCLPTSASLLMLARVDTCVYSMSTLLRFRVTATRLIP